MKYSHNRFNAIILFSFMTSGIWAQPVEYDIEIGKHYSQVVETQMSVYRDYRLTSYVTSVGNRLVAELGDQPFEYSFKVADTHITNAFALPGGYTYVTRGLLALVNDESELAGVMAHEIMHVDKRHSVHQMNRIGYLPGLLRLPGQIIGTFSESLGSLLMVPGDFTAEAFNANYSRSNEKEADKKGVLLAANAGYDPHGLTSLLEKLADEAELMTGEVEKASLLNDHPVTDKRLKYLDKETKAIEYIPDGDSGNAFLDLIDGMIYGQNPEHGVIIENKFMHPVMGLFMQFPADWHTTNSPVMVGAAQNGGEAVIMLSGTDNTLTPMEYGYTIASNIADDEAVVVTENKPIDINGFSGHTITLVDQSGKDDLYLYLIWLNVGMNVFQLSGYGLDGYQDALESSLHSFRRLSEAEWNGIQIQRIEIIEARQGESLSEVSKRTGNVLDFETTAIINGLEVDSKFAKGQKVKVVTESPYITN